VVHSQKLCACRRDEDSQADTRHQEGSKQHVAPCTRGRRGSLPSVTGCRSRFCVLSSQFVFRFGSWFLFLVLVRGSSQRGAKR
jgi:hypothetical protein